jgi:spermidine synthase
MTTLDLAADDGINRREGLAQWTRVLCVLFFFSGFPALIYQLVWQRTLFRIFGVNIESVTIVVTAFMLGLGFGSLLGGCLSKRCNIALLPLLAVIEILTGTFGIFSLAIFDQVGALTAGWPLPAMAAVNLGLVLVPTLLMGATLPLMVAHLVRHTEGVGSAVGLLYYVNTLGAGAACLLCAVLLFPFLGMRGSIADAVAINAAVAAGALVAHWRDRNGFAPAPVETRTSAACAPPALALIPLLTLAAAGGFVSLSFEIFFFRTVSYASGSSATAFAVTLSAFLVGLASGARRAGERCAMGSPGQATRYAIGSLTIASLVGFLFLPLLDHLAWLDRGVLGLALLMVYLLARCWGALLPYLAEVGINPDADSGMHTALLYLANILGAAAGSILTGFVAMDRLSLTAIATALVVAGLLCVMLLIAALKGPPRERLAHGSVALALALAAMLFIPRWSNGVLERLQWKGSPLAKPFTHVIENRSGIITVDTNHTVFGNGMYDGHFNVDLEHDNNGIIRPYALSLFHPAPRDVLMIGLSSGSWGQVVANNPAVRTLTVVEINPGYATLIAQFPEVASLLTNPKVTIIIDDGRRWLNLNRDRHFDAIVSNTTWYFRANVTNLLSAEFLALVKDHLNPGGIFFYNTTDSARAQRTGCLVFGEGARFTNHMVVSSVPIAWDFQRWRRTLEAYRIDGKPQLDPRRSEDSALLDKAEAMAASLTSTAPYAERPIEPCSDVLTHTAGMKIMTDDNMGSEWRYFLALD